ncbi:DNA cytosine methyltransferase [Rhizobium ruizarguesonis]|uniref:DNA cytosine methyltransferase n=1 Tax=Rhizobium ruizarguesonis TaxID=2081791 RepID=UPI001030CE12|nr:DNA cytosine methyltransferase [Rhizobium ruizarguesonis]NEI26819.1 DNA (cytosine-5-)-methyltransferase [Rhizobium ruizarguesonis]TBB95499.1 DNA cytosine methyltransferase [Rhizobium ruizarguesonis]
MGVFAVDLFCGAGGLSLGLKRTGIDILAGLDNDPSCRFPYETNIQAPFIEQDVEALSVDALAGLFPSTGRKVLVACAPCQPFSGLTAKNRGEDTRWKLLLEVQRLTVGLKPDVLSLENVPRLAKLPLWEAFVQSLRNAGYHVSWGVKDASRYSVPQRRTRLVLLASLHGEIGLPAPNASAPTTVRQTIANLPAVEAGQSLSTDILHRSRNLTQANLARIRQSRQSGTWRDWPVDLRAACHTRTTGKTFPSVYGRMAWDAPSPTITTQFYGFGNGRFGHPEQDRALTLREGATLQSFPPDFQFIPTGRKISFKEIGRLIGNAVPPKLAEAIGTHIVSHLQAVA